MGELDDFQKEQLFKIIKYGKIRKLTSFFNDIENTDIDFEDISGKTPLMCAVCYDDKDDVRTHMVRTLLRHGCDVDKQDMYGCTALMYSCMDCHSDDVTRLLTKKGNSNPNIQDNFLNTALMHSVVASNAAALQILVTSSATRSKVNLDLQNNQGLTALELAIKLKMSDCCKVLVREGCADIRQTKDLKGLRILLGTEVDSTGKEHSFMRNDNHSLSVPISTRSSMSSTSRCSTPVPDIYRQNSRNSFTDDPPLSSRSNYSSSSNQSNRSYDISWTGSPRKISKRALTPLLQENAKIVEVDEHNLFGNRTRLPSIPSGKRLCMVNSPSTFTTQTDDLNVV